MKIRRALSLFACLVILLVSSELAAQDLSQPAQSLPSGDESNSAANSTVSAPSISIKGMIHPNTTAVTLIGTVSANNAATLFWLACGTSSQSMNTATPKGTPILGTSTVTSTVTGLKPNTTYYFQFFAANAAGTSASGIQSFTTGDSEVRAALPEQTEVQLNSGMDRRSVQHIKQ
jgi:hypothetical protein